VRGGGASEPCRADRQHRSAGRADPGRLLADEPACDQRND
jgi:hypothetical protein